MFKSIETQMRNFLEGFYEVVPKRLISMFTDKELELLISGCPEIDVADLRDNTEYVNYVATQQLIVWFWECLSEMDQKHLAMFVQFVTGTSKVPLGGFVNLMGMRGPQKLNIHRCHGEDRLPTAHTCFNQLDLPVYSSKAQLQRKMMQAITEGNEGFGFV
ncbi:MAG: hypothetical protein KVP17_002834 [Porospora cf. gigantea B]|nr:MAG: hypothetical protein KVP17_002834 [Porospora cf. gigantea B]